MNNQRQQHHVRQMGDGNPPTVDQRLQPDGLNQYSLALGSATAVRRALSSIVDVLGTGFCFAGG